MFLNKLKEKCVQYVQVVIFFFFISTSYLGQKEVHVNYLIISWSSGKEVDYEAGIPGSSSGSTSIRGLDRPVHLSGSS